MKGFALILLFCLLFTVFQSPASAEDGSGLGVSVDPRIELLTTVQYLAGYGQWGMLTRHSFSYVDKVEAHFRAYENHPAVALYRELMRTGFAFDAPVASILHYKTNGKELIPRIELPSRLKERAADPSKVEQFFALLSDFIEDSSFDSFFTSHRPFYNQLISDYRQLLNGLSTATLQAYFGDSDIAFQIILSPLNIQGGYGPSVENEGRKEVFSIIGPHSVKDDKPAFGSYADARELVWHEFSHSFCNPVIDANWELLSGLEDTLYVPFKDSLSSQAYSTWKSACYEYLVRAVVLRLVKIHGSIAEYDEILEREIEKGFVYMELFLEALETYESQRSRYADFEAFGPELARIVTEAAAQP